MLFTRAMVIRPRDIFKPIAELDRALTALEAANFAVEGLREGPDPPDCQAILDGARAGIEVTELIDATARKRTRAGNFSYVEWDQPSFLARIQQIVDTKAAKPFQGGPYARKVLVIWTDEFVLGREAVERFLAGQSFTTSAFSDVVLGLDYHPDHEYVAFGLALARKVMCGCPRRCKRSFDGAGDDRVRSCVRPRSAALSHAAGRYGDTQTRRRSKKRALSPLTLIAFPGLNLSDQFALTVPRPPSSPTHQRKRLPIRPAPALILDILHPC
jgi:hypothetical protein